MAARVAFGSGERRESALPETTIARTPKRMTTPGIKLIVRGRNACFTRPEMKVERVSYDVMTPSAARCARSGR